MWRFVILYNSKCDFFDFKVLHPEDIERATVVYQGLDRIKIEDAVSDMNQVYQALSSLDRWRQSDAVC